MKNLIELAKELVIDDTVDLNKSARWELRKAIAQAESEVALTLTLKPEDVKALAYALSVAQEETESYLADGDVKTDHGAEWPEVAKNMAASWVVIAAIATSLKEAGLADKCLALAGELRAQKEG